MHGPHPKPSAADPRLAPLDALFERALALEPASRPQSADELGKGLRKFLSGADTGDIARALGERVRVVRAKVTEKAREATDRPFARERRASVTPARRRSPRGERLTRGFPSARRS